MDIIRLYSDFSVDFKTEGHKHSRPGWVNTKCPYCTGHEGYHLGFNINGEFYTCWRCGQHPVIPTLSKILEVSIKELNSIIKGYGILVTRYIEPLDKIKKEHRLPTGVGPLLEQHKLYLSSRNFDPEYLEQEFNLLSTGPVSKLDQFDYKNRIIIPYIWDLKQVSFDSRIPHSRESDKERYKACPEVRELVPRKSILYGKQEFMTYRGIRVEGPTDVWRFGRHSFGVSGIKYTPKQVRLISKLFQRVAVCFDGGEPEAIKQANKLVAELRFRKIDSFRVDIQGDPGGMDQTEANYLVKQLIH